MLISSSLPNQFLFFFNLLHELSSIFRSSPEMQGFNGCHKGEEFQNEINLSHTKAGP